MFRFSIGPRVDELGCGSLFLSPHSFVDLGSEASETALALPHFEPHCQGLPFEALQRHGPV